MAETVMLNIRIDKTLKEHALQVLNANGVSTTEYIKQAFEYLENNQELPNFSGVAPEDSYENRRRILAAYLKTVKPNPDFDPLDYKHARRERTLEKYEALV